MSSTPVWVPLVVAVVAVAGTLGAAFFTRRWADRREDQRWTREREAEETRWQRERDERREEWAREDAARWLTERRTVYAEYLLSLEAWKTAIRSAAVEAQNNGGLLPETGTALDSLEQKSQSVYEILSMLAPGPLVRIAVGSFNTLSSWAYYLDAQTDEDGDPDESDINYSDESHYDDKRLRDAIRQDLGVDPPSI